MKTSRRAITASALMLLALAPVGTAQAASRRNATQLVRVTELPQALLRGERVTVSLLVRNAGTRMLRPAVSAWLAPASRGRATRLSLRLANPGPVRPGQRDSLPLTFTVPASQEPGRYRLVLCPAAVADKGCIKSGALKVATSPAPIRIAVGRNPVTVSPTLDTAAAATATIGSGGGALTATAPDGSKLTLTIPRNALAGSESITLTPIASLGGADITPIAAAQIDPAGLTPLGPVTLEVAPARTVALGQQIAFGFGAGGTQFRLVPLALGKSIEIPVAQFGGVGLGQATAAQLAAREARPPSDQLAAFEQQYALGIYGLRTHRLTAAAADSRTTANSFVNNPVGTAAAAFSSSVLPALNNAGSSVAAWSNAASIAISWERQVTLASLDTVFAAQIDEIFNVLFEQALPKVFNQVVAKCNGGIDTVANLRTVLQLARIAELIGDPNALGGLGAIGAAEQKCSQLNLKVNLASSDTTWSANGVLASTEGINSDQVNAASTPTPLQLQPGSGTNPNVLTLQSANVPVNEGVLTYTMATMYQQAGCSFSPPLINTSPGVTYISFRAILTVAADLFAAVVPPSTLDVSTNGADEMDYTFTCPYFGSESLHQPAQAMQTIASVTQQSPVRLTDAAPSGSFGGSFANSFGNFSTSGTITVNSLG